MWATSAHDVYVMLDSCINHWSGFTRQVTRVMHLAGGPMMGPSLPMGRVQVKTSVILCEDRCHPLSEESLSQKLAPLGNHRTRVLPVRGSQLACLQVSTMAAGHGLLAAGGFTGELALKNLQSQRPISMCGFWCCCRSECRSFCAAASAQQHMCSLFQSKSSAVNLPAVFLLSLEGAGCASVQRRVHATREFGHQPVDA